MTQDRQPEERAFELAVRLTQADTEAPLSDERSASVYAKVQANLHSSPPRPRLAWAWGLAPLALAVGMAVVFLRPGSPAPPASAITLTPLVLYRGGEPGQAGTEVPGEFTLEPGERLDLRLPFGRVALFGPLSGSWAPSQFNLRSGRAIFAIPPGAAEASPFVVQTPEVDLLSPGGAFEVEVIAGRLAGVRIETGEVQTRDHPERPTHEAAWPIERTTPLVLTATLVTPWWSPPPDAGHLVLHSSPEGAVVVVDGRRVGTTPLVVAWAAGEHTITMDLPGRERVRRTVVLPPGGSAQVQESLPIAQTEPNAADAVAGAALPSTSDEAPLPPEPEPEPPVGRTRPRRGQDLGQLLAKGRCGALDREVNVRLRDEPRAQDQARLLAMGAECVLRSGRKAEAQRRFAQIAERYPETSSGEAAHFEVARLAEEQGTLDEAQHGLEAYLSRYPSGRYAESARLRRCELMVRSARLDQAEICLAEFERRHPSALRSAAATMLHAELARTRGRSAEALAGYRRYLTLAPEGEAAERAHFHLCALLHEAKSPDERPEMLRYLELHPSGPNADQVRKWMSASP